MSFTLDSLLTTLSSFFYPHRQLAVDDAIPIATPNGVEKSYLESLTFQ